jgi:hypothetical protein
MRIKKPHNQHRPRVNTEFPVDTFQMRPHGRTGNPQEVGYLAITAVLYDVLEDLALALGEFKFSGHALPGGLAEVMVGFAGFGHGFSHWSWGGADRTPQ